MTHEQPNRPIEFSRLTGDGIKVAVIDSGVDGTHPKIGKITGGVGLCMGQDGQILSEADCTDRAGHGTACAGIIRKKAPDAMLYSVRIFDQTLAADGRALAAAIHWSVDQGMDVVNLSLGTTDPGLQGPLAAACRRAARANVILVAAEHNEGQTSYPAALPTVIGVTGGGPRDPHSYYYRSGATIECAAYGDAQRLCWLQGAEIMIGGTSFAAPHITGLIALIRQQYPGASIDEVRHILQANAHAQPAKPLRVAAPAPTASADLSWIRKAALYPFNKEMHALVRGRDLLDFQITGIADPAGKGLGGKDAGAALGLPDIGVRVQPRLASALDGADTLILGYVDQLSRIGKKDLLRDSVRTALDRDCNAFSLLAVPEDRYGDLYALAAQKGLRIAYPALDPADVQQALGPNSASPVGVPVLGVFGTSSQQGKFTLQLALRRHLLNMDYQVGQIGTEHHAALFGMDLAFPMGYASNVDLPLDYYVPYLDYKMRQICRARRPDIMLVGSQSGTIPYDIHEHSTLTLASTAFLLGTKPDACILVVNSIDADEYIRDTIDGIRAQVRAPTLMLAMSDKEKHVRTAYGRTFVKPRPLGQKTIDDHLRRLQDRFGLPAVSILDKGGQRRMVDAVIDYFAEENAPCNSA